MAFSAGSAFPLWQSLTVFVEKRYFYATAKDWTMATTSLNISLPEALKEFVHERVAEKAYSNPSDYVRALIHGLQKRRAEEKLEQLLLQGLASGEPRPYDFEEIRARGATAPCWRKAAGMTKRAVQRRLAEQDIVDQALHIHRSNPAAARRFLEAVDSRSPCCLTCPRSVHLDTMAASKVCACGGWGGFEGHFIFYRPTVDGIEVIRVLHASRDLAAVLDENPDE